MADEFDDRSDTESGPAREPFAITPDDTDPLPIVPKAIYVGTGGTIVLRGIESTEDVTFVSVPDGFVLAVRASHVRATGTTAQNLIGLA